jgi:hypothetical protein
MLRQKTVEVQPVWIEGQTEINAHTLYTEHDGLCSTCKYSRSCIFRKEERHPVHECNEFEIASIDAPAASHEVVTNIGTNDSMPDRRYKGLCMNCENRLNCRFASTDGGVWHCEEYR